MTISVYSKKGCEKCDSAKIKLSMMGFDYTEHDLNYHLMHHEGWRDDHTTDLRAYCDDVNGKSYYDMPVIEIDGLYYSYSQAMRELRSIKKAIA